MSYSDQEAQWEREEAIAIAIEQRDSERLYELANLEYEEGNDETAADLKRLAKNIDNEDMAFDRERDNNL